MNHWLMLPRELDRVSQTLTGRIRELAERYATPMLHLLEPTHNKRYVALLDDNYPHWREARAELNALPLTAELWRES